MVCVGYDQERNQLANRRAELSRSSVPTGSQRAHQRLSDTLLCVSPNITILFEVYQLIERAAPTTRMLSNTASTSSRTHETGTVKSRSKSGCTPILSNTGFALLPSSSHPLGHTLPNTCTLPSSNPPRPSNSHCGLRPRSPWTARSSRP